jgi:hypothetical protein
MSTPQDRMEAILGYLSHELHRGILFLNIVKALHTAYNNQQLTSARDFFAGTYEACLRESLISFSKIVMPDQNSITIDYLLNCAIQSPRVFPRITKEDLQKQVMHHKAQLDAFRPLFENVKVQRDRILAHLDRKHINDPSAVFAEPIDMAEVERCFKVLLQILNGYKRVFDNSELSLKDVGESIQEDVAYLVQLMQFANTPDYDRIQELLQDSADN